MEVDVSADGWQAASLPVVGAAKVPASLGRTFVLALDGRLRVPNLDEVDVFVDSGSRDAHIASSFAVGRRSSCQQQCLRPCVPPVWAFSCANNRAVSSLILHALSVPSGTVTLAPRKGLLPGHRGWGLWASLSGGLCGFAVAGAARCASDTCSKVA